MYTCTYEFLDLSIYHSIDRSIYIDIFKLYVYNDDGAAL